MPELVTFSNLAHVWSHAPHCLSLYTVSSCNPLEPPQNGNIMTTSTVFQGRATYSCIEGYELKGEDVRICQANSFWNGTAPFCTCKFQSHQGSTHSLSHNPPSFSGHLWPPESSEGWKNQFHEHLLWSCC